MELAVLPSKNAVLLRALANIALGAVLLLWPGLTLLVLVYVFAINILIVGITTLFEPAFDKKRSAILTTILGLAGIVAGIYLMIRPEVSAELIAILIAFWAILFGLVDIYLGFTGKDQGNILYIIVGIVSVIFGIYVLNYPLASILSLIWVIGWYCLIVGLIVGCIGLFFYPKTKN